MFRRLRRRLRYTRPDGTTPAFRLPLARAATAATAAEPSALVARLLAAAAAARLSELQQTELQQPELQQPELPGAELPQPASAQIVTIDGRRYVFGDLPEDVQRLLADLLKADELIQERQQRLMLLQRGQLALLERLRQGLTAIPPMADAAP